MNERVGSLDWRRDWIKDAVCAAVLPKKGWIGSCCKTSHDFGVKRSAGSQRRSALGCPGALPCLCALLCRVSRI
jgi:hypothetical protein